MTAMVARHTRPLWTAALLAAAVCWLEGLRTRITTVPDKAEPGNPLALQEYE